MYGGIFQQNQPATTAFGGQPPMGFPQNNGVAFNNTPQSVKSNLTNEEFEMIRRNTKNNLTLTPEELVSESWNLHMPDGSLAIEVLDPKENLVRIKGTNKTFNLVVTSDDVVAEVMTILKNIGYTAKLTTPEVGENPTEVNKAIGIVLNLLPKYYHDAMANYKNLVKNSSNMVSGIGYQGNWGGNGYFNGSIGAVPNYFIPNGNMGYQQPMPGAYQQPTQPQMMPQQMPYQQPMGYQQPMPYQQQMGAPMPMAGTMMGGNPFVQNGQPQQQPQMTAQQTMAQPQTPQIQNIPMPGAPVTPTANPAMGGVQNNNATTANAKV